MQHGMPSANGSESDWLISINGTRAVTIKRNKASSRQVSTVGRVQTPTLSMVVERETMVSTKGFIKSPF